MLLSRHSTSVMRRKRLPPCLFEACPSCRYRLLKLRYFGMAAGLTNKEQQPFLIFNHAARGATARSASSNQAIENEATGLGVTGVVCNLVVLRNRCSLLEVLRVPARVFVHHHQGTIDRKEDL